MLRGILVLLSLFTGLASAQTAGRISGQILDQSQSSIPGAKVVAENAGTGSRREIATDQQGRYVFADLPIGKYKVSVEASGFQSQMRSDLQLSVASALTVDFSLPAGTLSQAVEVKGTVESVDPTAANGELMNNKSVMELPINGRDYARFSLLTPGAVSTNNFIAMITFNGMQSIHNAFSIDGVDASRVDQPYMANGFERGARLLTGSLDTVEEFRVQTSNYNAEYGRAAGTDIRVVTKSGGNQMHATLFEFFRNDFFDARNFFNTKPTAMPKFRYNNFGGNLSGKLIKDKTFFFANYEGSRQRVGIVGSGTVPSQTLINQVLATSPALAPLLAQFPKGQTATSNPLITSYLTSAVSQVREDTGSIKVDHNFTSNDHVYLRFNLNDTEVFGPLFGVSAAKLGVNDYQQVPVTTTNVALHYQKIFSPRLINEFLAGVQRWGSQINSELPLPTLSITGIIATPGNGGYSRTNSMVYQYGDTMSYIKGSHTIKFGATAWKSQVNGLSHPSYNLAFTSINDLINNSPNQVTFSGGNPGSGLRQLWVGSFVQDTWQVRPKLTIDLGLRYDIGVPNYDVQGKAQTFDPRINALSPPGQQWFAMNKKNFAPRFAVAWQPREGMTVRAGYGLFYQQYPPGFGSAPVTNTVPGNFSLLRANIPSLSFPITPFIGQGTTNVPTVGGFNWDLPNLYAQQWNLTLSQVLPKHFVLQVAYVGNHGVNLRASRNINLIDPALGRRPLTQFGNVNIEFNDRQDIYHGLQTSINRRFSSGVQVTVNYTWAKSIDNVQDYGLYTTLAQNMNCNSCERGASSNDIRHNSQYNVLYELPFGKGHKFLGSVNGIGGKLLSGWQINSLGLLHTGIATFPTIGVNTFGNSNLTNQRPDVVAGISTTPATQSVAQFWNPAAFSIPLKGTFGNAGRGTLYGPNFVDFDASLMKQTSLSERTKLEFRAEVFNLFNHPNFDLPNAVIGTPSFGQIFNTYGRTLGLGTSRQMQMALKLRF